MVCLGRPYRFKFFKGCLPQILLGLFLNTLTQMINFALIYTNFFKVINKVTFIKKAFCISIQIGQKSKKLLDMHIFSLSRLFQMFQ